MKTTTLRNLWAAVVVLGLATGCGGNTVQVKGRVTDGEGTQQQALVSGADRLGGSGTVAAATQVRASTVGQDGKLTVVAEGELEAQGRYTLDVPAGEERLVLEAVDASGQVVASALLEATAEGQDAVAPPMDGESSLEAEVFLQMAADARAETVDMVDVRARINANMAAAARQQSSTSEDFRSRVKALADAVRAAQQAELEMYAKAGVQTSQSALFQQELAAAAALNVALDAGSSVEQAYDTFHAELRAAAERLGAKVEEQAQAERAASASFRATVKARLSAEDAQPLVDAALRASAGLEARASGAALSAILAAANAADDVQQQAVTASTTLRAQVRASTSAAAAAQAFASFGASVAGSTNVQASVLGNYLGVNATNQLAVSTAVQATATAAATLDATLDAAISAAVSSNAVDVTLLATKTAEAYQAYATAVRAQATALSAFGAKAAPAVELLLVAEGSFQLGQ
ncbi:hypothetical protein JQX13_19035 [Archangium violaceum]|uniref:hypothetical protein n=1 Tax=Archangium violaceum TaxID=83451 RepID=UPI00193C3EEC|nr:hypothetical protein [Archangium violaceum]QRK11963.1 hypothetical protein JQX13_19035 [Archangium violaceum]